MGPRHLIFRAKIRLRVNFFIYIDLQYVVEVFVADLRTRDQTRDPYRFWSIF